MLPLLFGFYELSIHILPKRFTRSLVQLFSVWYVEFSKNCVLAFFGYPVVDTKGTAWYQSSSMRVQHLSYGWRLCPFLCHFMDQTHVYSVCNFLESGDFNYTASYIAYQRSTETNWKQWDEFEPWLLDNSTRLTSMTGMPLGQAWLLLGGVAWRALVLVVGYFPFNLFFAWCPKIADFLLVRRTDSRVGAKRGTVMMSTSRYWLGWPVRCLSALWRRKTTQPWL